MGALKALQSLNLARCEALTSLPERLGECAALQSLHLSSCAALTSLPERLGECAALQSLDLSSCTALTSLPDLSGLSRLRVQSLPDQLRPWEANGRKAFAVAA